MHFPEYRGRRSRRKATIRRMLQETHVGPQDLICPLFVADGKHVKEESAYLPGVYRYSVDRLKEPVRELAELGVGAVLLFGIPNKRDELARDAVRADGVIGRALAEIKTLAPQIVTITDVGVSAYTSHGHAGLLQHNMVDNDATLELLAEMAVIHAQRGVDFVSPAASMDGQVGFIRETLDEEGLDQVGILACSARYRSSYEQVSNPAVDGVDGVDRSTYQMDPANIREALREASMDVEEGADMLMVKPALAYLDVIVRIHNEYNVPIIGFSGSGEYQMVHAVAEKGWVDGERAMMENLLAIKRAGAEGIVTYHAFEAARVLNR
ncbi:MAG: porphobilinogen synthase [Deltaproteobacteria bacterium]|nr:porphobilinogen synthase [Deltaproteobacteria bacterium]